MSGAFSVLDEADELRARMKEGDEALRGVPMMVPKPYAVFSDAIDEASAYAARKCIEAVLDRQADKKAKSIDSPDFYARIAEIIDHEVTNAVCERFAFVEPREE